VGLSHCVFPFRDTTNVFLQTRNYTITPLMENAPKSSLLHLRASERKKHRSFLRFLTIIKIIFEVALNSFCIVEFFLSFSFSGRVDDVIEGNKNYILTNLIFFFFFNSDPL
jgi:hypothetical protein